MRIIPSIILFALCVSSCSDGDTIPLKVELGTRSISKLPFVIAADQGLYRKYGLDVDLRMPPPDYEDGISTHSTSLAGQVWSRVRSKIGFDESWQSDIFIDGLTPNMVKRADRTRYPHRVALAATDCIARAHIVGSRGIERLENLKGKRLGISGRRDTTTGFVALTLAKRMGWDPVSDISIKLNGRDIEALDEGLVDAIVASEVRYAQALQRGYPILEDTQTWDVALAGNSVMVTVEWLQDTANHEAITRFLKATAEGVATFHQDPELAISVLQKWHGIPDRAFAATMYQRGQWTPRKPFPCYEGIKNTLELYDSNELRQYSAEDFYEDSFLKRLDENGFIDSLYH